MNRNHLFVSAILVAMLVCVVRGACPSADLTGDCFVDFEDFAILASQWLTTDPCIPDDFVYIPNGTFQMGDSIGDGFSDERPVHTVQLDSFAMGKFEVTNAQYCQYLNSALESSSIHVSAGMVRGSANNHLYCDTSTSSSDSQIFYSGGVFSVRTKSGRNMSNDPMVCVSWYGAVAYCNWRSQQEGKEICYNTSDPNWPCDFNKHGFRLPTEAEWEYAARGGFAGRRFPWGDTISHGQANYYSYWEGGRPYIPYDVSTTEGCHPLWNDGIYPYTSPVGFFDGTMKYKTDYNWPGSATSYQTTSGSNNYGLYDIAGNVWEWCNDWYSDTYYSSSPPNNPTGPTSGNYRVFRGGSWSYYAGYCRVASRYGGVPDDGSHSFGFRVVLDLN
jgi:formylglycine-generating enzyme required for sulfatase activity